MYIQCLPCSLNCMCTKLMYVPVVMYVLWLFIKNYNVYQFFFTYMYYIIIRDVGFYHFTKFCCSRPSGFRDS